MKKSFLYVLGMLLSCTLLYSCFEDEGNYDYTDLPRFEVDTVGVNTLLSITQFDVVNLTPKLIYEGDKSDLDFIWSAYRAENYGSNIADTLANTENFNQKITLAPDKYILEFCAVNRNTGLTTKMRYTMNVESYAGPGLMVFYTNGTNCDVDIIRTKTFMGAVTKNEVRRNIYTNIESNPKLTGTPIAIGDVEVHVDIVTDKEAIQVSRDDLSMIRSFEQMFYDDVPTKNPQGYRTQDGTDDKCFINDGKAYVSIYGSEIFGTARAMNGDSYYASPYSVFAYGMNHVFYDEEHCRFLYSGMFSGTLETVSDKKLENLNRTLLTLQRGFTDGKIRFSNYAYAVMKDRNDASKRYLMNISAARSALDIKLLNEFDITAFPGITKATGYGFSESSPLFYYSTDNSLYVCPFNLDQNTINMPSAASWTAPAGETITYMQLFKAKGIDLSESPTNKYLLVATYNGSMGKVYLLKTDMASGVIDPTPLEIYDGFGKIGCIEFKSN
ncbi:MAG: hypothetical protein J6Z18_01430 [Prevotella sp.]|nr:hypothetical protein [Prevotella sp.]